MAEKYRKIICPNGHYSDAIKENNPIPRLCKVCGQQYLRNAKLIWCDTNGNTFEEDSNNSSSIPKDTGIETVISQQKEKPEVDIQEERIARRRRRNSFLYEPDETEQVVSTEEPQNERVGTVQKVDMELPAYCLTSGDYSIQLMGEGILGREHVGSECLAVNQFVSRSHCYYIVTKQKGLTIRDAGSLNGTFVDLGSGRVAVSQKEGVYLKAGDRLWLADMLFEVKEAQ